MARGIAPRLNQWENDLLAKYFPYNDGRMPKLQPDQFPMLQLGVRPIRFYEIAFPEPCLNDVLQTIQPSQSWNPAYNKYIAVIRKLMRLEKMPAIPPIDDKANFLNRLYVEACAIGLKKDNYDRGPELI